MLAISCAGAPTTKLTDDGRKVKIRPRLKSKKCETIGKVVGMNLNGALELAKNDARNQAGDMDADTIIFEEVINNGKKREIHGMAYRCKKK